ncbi:MAG: Gfo/Idh/MocA family oxidoreductase [SAR202 cluster bacterium]|nr:Gfo/Idh/MocA family oxidoreductase [SAR202 cluster bacterium]
MRAAIIGCGHAGRGHAEDAKRAALEIVGFCDIIEASAEKLCADYGGKYATTDPEKVMKDKSIDIVFIATHHDAHKPMALAAARAGKHILLEKPMTVTKRDAIEVAEAVKKAGVKLAINYKFRLSPAVLKVKELIKSPRVSHGQLAMSDSRPGASRWIWHGDDGGGLLISTAAHTVDILSYLMDSDAERVYAEGRLFEPEGKGTHGYPDGVVGTILWKSGGISTFISADQGQNDFLSKWFVTLYDGTRSASIHAHMGRAELGGCEITHLDNKVLPAEKVKESIILTNLLKAIKTNGDTVCNVRDGVRTVAICNALDESAKTGKPVRVTV